MNLVVGYVWGYSATLPPINRYKTNVYVFDVETCGTVKINDLKEFFHSARADTLRWGTCGGQIAQAKATCWHPPTKRNSRQIGRGFGSERRLEPC